MSDEPCPYVAGTVTRYCTLTPFTLTDAEREAIAAAIAEVDYEGRPPSLTRMRDTLRGLLERLK